MPLFYVTSLSTSIPGSEPSGSPSLGNRLPRSVHGCPRTRPRRTRTLLLSLGTSSGSSTRGESTDGFASVLPESLVRFSPFCVSGHCRYATALHGRQLSLLQMEGAYRGVERGQRTRSSINLRSVFRPPRFLRNLATYRGRVVRALLSHYNNDPLQVSRTN